MRCYAMLCYASALLCQTMLGYVMLCHAMQCRAMLCYPMLYYAVLRFIMLCYSMLCYAVLEHDMPCYAVFWYAMLCYAMPSYVMPCHLLLCYLKHAQASSDILRHLQDPPSSATQIIAKRCIRSVVALLKATSMSRCSVVKPTCDVELELRAKNTVTCTSFSESHRKKHVLLNFRTTC